MSENQRKILDMLAAGKITADEAEKLLEALGNQGAEGDPGPKYAAREAAPRGKYLRIMINPGSKKENVEKVNIRVPLKLIRAGLKWASLIPKEARSRVHSALKEKGIDMDFDSIKAEDIEELVATLDELTVDVEGNDTVKIFIE